MSAPERSDFELCVLDALRAILAQQRKAVPGDLGPDTVLFGAGGLLDSMGLVTLVVDVEQALADRFGLRMTLADDRAMSQRSSPFRSAAALAAYIHQHGTKPHAS